MQHLTSPFKSQTPHLWIYGAITGPNGGPTGVPVILSLPWEETSHRLSKFQLTFASFSGFEWGKKRTSNVDFAVKSARSQKMDAGFKISRAGGGLSPAKEDVIISRIEIVMFMSE